MLKSLVMTSGEMEYEEVFRFIGFQDVGSRGLNNTMATDTFISSGGLNYFTMSTILWVVFVILMPILFANLLVSCYLQLCVTCYHIYVYIRVYVITTYTYVCIDWSCCW